MGCGSSVELFDKSVYTSLPGTPQPEHRTDRNRNTIEDDKTLRGDLIQKQYARKTREEKLKMMDKRRSSAAKEMSDRAMEDRERLSLSSRYGSRATSRTTSRTASPSVRVTPLAMANGIATPQRDEVRSAGPIKKLSDLNEATSDSLDLRGLSKQADLNSPTVEGTTEGGEDATAVGESGDGPSQSKKTESASENDDKENRLDGKRVDVESAGARKGKGKGQKRVGKGEKRGSGVDEEQAKQGVRPMAEETGEPRTVGRKGAESGDDLDRTDDNVNHPHAVDSNTDGAGKRESFRVSNDSVAVKNQDGDNSEKDKVDGGALREKETKTLGSNEKNDQNSVRNKHKSKQKKRKPHNADRDSENNVSKGADDQKQADDVDIAGDTILSSKVDETLTNSLMKPEIRVSNGETFNNSNNNATVSSTGDLGSDLDIKAGSDLDLMAPSFPSFSAKAGGAKKGKRPKKRTSSKRGKRGGESVGETGARDQ